jgi:hypothetical protein
MVGIPICNVMSLLASPLLGINKKRDALVLELREYFESHGGPNWRTDPSDLPIEFSEVSESTVLINVKKADDAWKAPKSVNFRITDTGDNEIGDRTGALVEHIKDKRPLDPSHAYYDPERKSLDFGDGRHRFALLRDAGVLCIPMNSDTPENLMHLEAKEDELKLRLAEIKQQEAGIDLGVNISKPKKKSSLAPPDFFPPM